MAYGTTPSVRGAGAGPKGLGPAGLAVLVVLGACSPVAAWRDLTGVSRNDPNPATTPNTKNLAAGEASPYPNLATVPPPPTRELTEAELRHLTQSLVADRVNAKYTDQQLRGGTGAAEPPPVQPAPPAGAAPTGVTFTAAPPVQAAPMAAAKMPPPIVRPVAPRADTAAGLSSPAGAPEARETMTKPATTDAALNGMASGLRKPGQPPEPGPMESSLVPPQIPEKPQPEAPQPPPPPPRLAAIPAAKTGVPAPPPPEPPQPPPPAPRLAAIPAAKGGAAPPLPPPEPPPPSTGTAAFQPPPPPVIASPAPARAAMTPPAGESRAPPAAAATPVAEITFAAGSKSLSDSDVAALKKVAALYREHPGKLRVVGYVWVVGAADPLATFGTALDRAHAVAAALAKTGIPAAKVAAEASPAKAAAAGDHVEVLLEP
jgi:outer membrane protein OmpA-like peptidoglycan-associated protein